MATQPITDSLLYQLGDEMREYVRDLRSEARMFVEDEEARLNNELANLVEDIAVDRGLLVRFAFLLRSLSSRASALAAITGGVSA